MSMLRSLLLTLVLAFWGQPSGLLAQDTLAMPEYIQVRTLKGKQHTGRLLYRDSTLITLQSLEGDTLTFLSGSIRSARTVSDEYIRKRTRNLLELSTGAAYFLGASAYGPAQGESYYMTHYLWSHQAAYGVTSSFSLRSGGSFGVFYVAPKWTLPLVRHRLAFAVEGVVGGIIGEEAFVGDSRIRFSNISLFQGLLTFGNRHTHLTLGGGLTGARRKWASSAHLSLAAAARLTPKFGLMTENYFIQIDNRLQPTHVLGGRIYGRLIAFDFGLAAFGRDFFSPVLPWLAIAVHLN